MIHNLFANKGMVVFVHTHIIQHIKEHEQPLKEEHCDS